MIVIDPADETADLADYGYKSNQEPTFLLAAGAILIQDELIDLESQNALGLEETRVRFQQFQFESTQAARVSTEQLKDVANRIAQAKGLYIWGSCIEMGPRYLISYYTEHLHHDG